MSEPKEAAWQVLDRVTTMRKNLLAAGYNLTPTNGKRAFLDGWQNIQTTEAEIERWAREYPDALNTGLQTRNTPGVDIDVLDEAVAEELQNLLWLMIGDNGQALVRYGRRPKRAVLFQTSESFDKLSTPFFISPNGDAHRVEVLCDGQQFIAHGTHPDTGAAYEWEGGEPASVPRDDLPHLSASVAAEFVAKATELMRGRGWVIRGKQKNGDARKLNGSATGGTADFDSIYGGREQKWAAAALTDLAAELAGMAPETGRNERLYRAAFRLGTMVARGWIDRATVEGRLLDACRANALERDTGADAVRASLRSGLDGGEAVPHPDLDQQTTPGAETWRNDDSPLIKTSAEFIAGFVPPEYVLVGILIRRFLYSLTGQTGAGKTAVMLRLAASTALGTKFAERETKKTRVLYAAAENPDDVRMRWIALAQHMGFDPNTIEVYFTEGTFTISKMTTKLRADAERCGGDFGLVVIDTGPAFFEGDDENSRTQMGNHARLMRALINIIPGGPTVVVNCHPVKNATADNLLPAGGGTFLNEVDGNLTCAKNDSITELHWQGKFRGPEFAPMNFLIKTVTHQDLKDSDGRLIPTVICEHITEQAKEDITAAALRDENVVLKFIIENAKASQSSIATAMGWKLYSGEPHKTKAGRYIKALIKGKLIKETRAGRYTLTPEGTKVLKGEDNE